LAYSGQERIGYETGYADGVYGRPRDNPYSITTVPRSYRAYEEGYDEGEGSTTPPRGPAGERGPTGAVGPQGVAGINGQDGADGLSTYYGVGPPVDGVNVPVDSVPGDSYVDTSDRGALYTKTGSTTWTFQSYIADVSLASQVDDTGGSPQVIYKGEAAAGAGLGASAWRIARITITTDGGGNDDLATQWADGNANFDNVWNNRAALSYS